MTGEGRRRESAATPSIDGVQFWPARTPLNEEMPRSVPPRPQGNVPVIVRLLWDTHEELVPARAIRWTRDHVMVMAKAPGAPENAHELLCWLRSSDVYRTIPRRAGIALRGGMGSSPELPSRGPV